MVCIYCGSATRVTNSRPQKRTNTTWRRRHCLRCSALFTTEEAALLGSTIAVLAADGSVYGFEREKLLISLYKSLGHRPTATTDACALTDTVIAALLPQARQATITTSVIIETAAKTLDRFDRSAGTHYRAYHPLPAAPAKRA